ncbi:MAG: hypothetical protein GF317_11675 [Candidatus Lokiarchaeota archaeon]|nr:hypothetical protein [Candidatus Lokiarchaeota archaeon]MBD3200306.1 hypothetical protein [Candidatus Lokiarchaeota archaeon]
MLTDWLDEQGVKYIKLDYQDPEDFDDPLMENETFNNIFCDMSACVESLPIVVEDDEKFYYGELWDLRNNMLNEERAREVFGI